MHTVENLDTCTHVEQSERARTTTMGRVQVVATDAQIDWAIVPLWKSREYIVSTWVHSWLTEYIIVSGWLASWLQLLCLVTPPMHQLNMDSCKEGKFRWISLIRWKWCFRNNCCTIDLPSRHY